VSRMLAISHEGANQSKGAHAAAYFVVGTQVLLLDAVVGGPHNRKARPHLDEVYGGVEEGAVSALGKDLGVESVDGQEVEGVDESEDASIEGSCYDISLEIPGGISKFVHYNLSLRGVV
jgi:hypothetical protein